MAEDETTSVRKIDNGYVISRTRWTKNGGCERTERFSPTDPLKGAMPKAKPKSSGARSAMRAVVKAGGPVRRGRK